ncbi:MAG: cytochrome c-type biogenesis protein [Myxococcota bacterium]|nr:cytochrome c-type biogenesis protein [Myxococcota bacterium]
MRALWTLWLVGMALAGSDEATVGLDTPPLGAPPSTEVEIDSRVEALTTRLRCPVCQGLNVAESRSEAALAMTARIRELVVQGYTQDQVVGYFTDRYGDWVLLEPPRTGINWLLWSGPAVLLAIGGVLVGLRLRRTEVATDRASEAHQPSGASSEDPYVAQLLEELEEVQ